jgi:hypothetical protein
VQQRERPAEYILSSAQGLGVDCLSSALIASKPRSLANHKRANTERRLWYVFLSSSGATRQTLDAAIPVPSPFHLPSWRRISNGSFLLRAARPSPSGHQHSISIVTWQRSLPNCHRICPHKLARHLCRAAECNSRSTLKPDQYICPTPLHNRLSQPLPCVPNYSSSTP